MKSAPFILMAFLLLFTGSNAITMLGFGVVIGLALRGK